MAVTPSSMLPLGTPAPDFQLPDVVSGEVVSLQILKSSRVTVVMFICNHCPYVVHIRNKLLEVVRHYQALGVSFIAISSNSVDSHPQDGPDSMRTLALQCGFSFPYLYDESQEVARQYQAACTPDFYVFDSQLKCAYRGRFDAATPGNAEPISGKDLSAALDALLAGNKPSLEQLPSMGCNIKWKVRC